MSLDKAKFFDAVRPLFGKLTAAQVEGMEIILAYCGANDVSRQHLAYMLATVFHETAKWMVPIREGARRYGPNYSDASARNAVAVAVGKGLIRTNYALPAANGHSYYGRGLVQITHEENYKRLGAAIGENLVDFPDKTLDWNAALKIMHYGMRDGLFRGKKLSDFKGFYSMRTIINGDVKTYGSTIAGYADTFYAALDGYAPVPVPEPAPVEPATTATQGSWPPAWWPFK